MTNPAIILSSVLKKLESGADSSYIKSLQQAIFDSVEANRQNIALVQSVLSLTPIEKTTIESLLKKRFPQISSFTYSLSPEILGGLKISVGDTLIDTSLKSSLKKITRNII